MKPNTSLHVVASVATLLVFAALTSGRAHAQPVDQETLVIGNAGIQDVSPVHDQGLLLDQIVFTRAGAIQRIDVQWNADHDVGPSVGPAFLVVDPGESARFNPVKVEFEPEDGFLWRFISFGDSEQVFKLRLDARSAAVPLGTNPSINRRNFPFPFSDGQRFAYEGDVSGVFDATIIGDFDAAPEVIAHGESPEVNEGPLPSLASPGTPDDDLIFYGKSRGQPVFPRAVHRLRVGDPDDYFLTLGGGLNNLGLIDAQSFAYHKHLQGFAQIFRNATDGETLSHGVSVLLADPVANGALLPRSFHPMTRTPVSLALAQLAGDASLDVVVADQEGGHLSFLVGRGGGSFTRGNFPLQPVGQQTGAGRPLDIAAADFDLDGRVDLVVAEFNQDRVRVLWNDGAGFFVDTGTVLPVGDQPVALAVGDFNSTQDPFGISDIAVACRASDQVAIIRHALYDPLDPMDPNRRTFLAATFFSPGDGPSDVATADLDGDGILDLAVPLEGDHTVEIVQGDGTGTFSAACSLAPVDPNGVGLVEPRPSGVALADFDGDGDIDVAACNVLANKVTVWLNLGGPGGGCFSAASFHDVGSEPTGIVVADVIGDDALDLVTANRGSDDATVLVGGGDGTFSSVGGATITGLSEPWRAVAGNFLGNVAKADLAFACAGNDTLALVEENPNFSQDPGAPAFRIRTSLLTGDTPRAVAAALLDGGTDLDLVTANAFSDDVSIHHRFVLPALGKADPESYRGPFDRVPSPVEQQVDTFRPTSVASFETTVGAGAPGGTDLVLSSFTTAGGKSRAAVQVLEGDGAGSFQTLFTATYPNNQGRRPVAVVAGDFDATSGEDFAVVDADNAEVLVYLRTGSGFALQPAIGLGVSPVPTGREKGPRYIVAVNTDHDPLVERLLVVCGFGSSLVVLDNDGVGGFSVTDVLLPAADRTEPRQVVVGQFDGDPGIDAALTVFGSGHVQVYLSGKGGGNFLAAEAVEFPVPGAHGITTADVDGDGDLDLAVSSLTLGELHLLINDGQSQDRFSAAAGNPFPAGGGPFHLQAADLDADGRDDVVVANAFGEADELLSTRTANYSGPVASRDGMKLAARIEVDGTQQIVLFDFRPAAGTTETTLTSSAGDKGGFAWDPVDSPAGSSTRLYYGNGGDGSLYVLRISSAP